MQVWNGKQAHKICLTSAEKIIRDSAKSAFTGGHVDSDGPNSISDYILLQYIHSEKKCSLMVECRKGLTLNPVYKGNPLL